MAPLEFNDLLPEMHVEILQHLEPYPLRKFSLTSKKYYALTDAIWKQYLDEDFPLSLEKTGSFFQNYSICKRRSLKYIDLKYRKLILLIESNLLEKIPSYITKLLPEKPSEIFLKFFHGKSVSALVNEQKDQRIRDLFYNLVKEEFNGCDDAALIPWTITFGQLTLLNNLTLGESSILPARKHGALDSLQYLANKVKIEALPTLIEAVGLGRIDMLEWSLNLIEFDIKSGFHEGCLLSIAACRGHKEMVLYLLKHFVNDPEQIQSALGSATCCGNVDILDVLLPLLPQTELSIDDLLKDLYLFKNVNETAACLKLLLDKGAAISKFPGVFRDACTDPDNEHAILLMLEHGADPNYPLTTNYLRNKNVVEMALQKGAMVWDEIIAKAEKNWLNGSEADRPVLQEIVQILKLHRY